MQLGWKKTKMITCPQDLEILVTFIGETSFLKVRSQQFVLTLNPTCMWKPWTRDQLSFVTPVSCVRWCWVWTSSGQLIPHEYISPFSRVPRKVCFTGGKKPCTEQLPPCSAELWASRCQSIPWLHPLPAGPPSCSFPLLFGCFNMNWAEGKGKKTWGFAASVEKATCYKENTDSWGQTWPED